MFLHQVGSLSGFACLNGVDERMMRVAFAGCVAPLPVKGNNQRGVRNEITDAIASGTLHWLQANSGEGILEPAYLLISAGVPVVVVDVMATVTSETDSPL